MTIFLSHASADKLFVRALAQDIRSVGLDLWIDEQRLAAGEELTPRITDAIRRSSHFLVVLSTSSVGSAWVIKELQIALDAERTTGNAQIVLLMKDICGLPALVSDRAYASFINVTEYEQGFKAIARRLNVSVEKASALFDVEEVYRPLKAALVRSNLRAADYETRRILYLQMGTETPGLDDVNRLECSALHTIDTLWLRYSNGRFGFSIQNIIACRFDGSTWEEFGDAIGWRKNGVWIAYEDAVIDHAAPEGHLPICGSTGLLDFDNTHSIWDMVAYDFKEVAKREAVMLIRRGGVRNFLSRILTQSDPIVIASHWMLCNISIHKRLKDCEEQSPLSVAAHPVSRD